MILFSVARPRVITQEEIMPLVGNLSRKNYYQVAFGGIKPGLGAYLGARGVNSFFSNNDFGLMCYQAELPGASLATYESSNYHGINEKFAHRRVYTPLNLSFYCDDQYKGIKFLEHWMEYCISGSEGTPIDYASKNYAVRMQYPDDPTTGYKSESTKIYKFERNVERTRMMEYSFIGLFPSNLSSTSVQYENGGELLDITCSFTYDRYIAGNISSFDMALNKSNNIISNLVNQIPNLLR